MPITVTPCVKQDTWHNSYRRWFPKLLRRQSSGDCRFNPIKDVVQSSMKVPEFNKHNYNDEDNSLKTLNDRLFPKVSIWHTSFLTILTNLVSSVVEMVSILSPVSNSLSLFSRF